MTVIKVFQKINDGYVEIPLGGAEPSTVVPSAPGTAAIGSSEQYARADHVHPAQVVPVYCMAYNGPKPADGSAAMNAILATLPEGGLVTFTS